MLFKKLKEKKNTGNINKDAEFEKVADYLKNNIGEGDLVITLGCGDVYKIAKMILGKN